MKKVLFLSVIMIAVFIIPASAQKSKDSKTGTPIKPELIVCNTLTVPENGIVRKDINRPLDVPPPQHYILSNKPAQATMPVRRNEKLQIPEIKR